jgi:uncharacterized repeat protein (TIGR03803 family)
MQRKRQCFPSIAALTALAITFSLAVCAQAQKFTGLAVFNGLDGHGPYAAVVQGTDGNFYGTTNSGGNDTQSGTLFRVTPSGKITSLYSFCSQPKCADGGFLSSAPVVGTDGNLYGVTGDGGAGRAGTFYRMTLDGKLTTLYSFCPADPCASGAGPNGIILGGDGNFYGTTGAGGNASSSGTIFSISPTGQFKLLYTFCSLTPNCLDGDNPYYPPILGTDGNFYGVTYFGGTQEGGVLYELTPSGIYTVLYNFCGGLGGCNDNGTYDVARDANGNFFGTTAINEFEITSTNQFIALRTWDMFTYPVWPYTGVTVANDGNVYGVVAGNYNNAGSIYEITPGGMYTTLYTFESGVGSPPVGPLFQGTNGSLYGVATYGPGNYDGEVFKFSNSLSPLVETVPVAGAVGQSVLILGNGLTGSTSVTFNGVEAAFTVESDTYIRATVPKGATTGTVSVVTPSGTLNSNPRFVVSK